MSSASLLERAVALTGDRVAIIMRRRRARDLGIIITASAVDKLGEDLRSTGNDPTVIGDVALGCRRRAWCRV